MSRQAPPTDDRDPDTTANAGDQARGVNFALQSIAESRQAAKKYKDLLNASPEINEHAIFVPDDNPRHPQAKAHAAILSYYTEVCKAPYIEAVDAEEFMEEPYTEASVPSAVIEGNDTTIDLEPNPYGTFPDNPEYEMEKVVIALDNLDWWSMRFLKINKHRRHSYKGTEVEVEKQKLVLPPKAIDDTFKRLDELASRYKLLLDVEPEGASGKT